MASRYLARSVGIVKTRAFLVPTLLAAGFSLPSPAQAASADADQAPVAENQKAQSSAVPLFRQESPILLAGHGSHRSHSSHSSHRSSSGGGVYYPPTTVYSPPPPPPPPPPPRPSRFLETPSPDVVVESGYTQIVMRVQSGLKAYGYYTGNIDGQVGPETRAAITRFQTDFSLSVTGTITPEVLRALSIKVTN